VKAEAGFEGLRGGDKFVACRNIFLIRGVVMETASKHGTRAKDSGFQGQVVDQLHKTTTDPSYSSLAGASSSLKTIA
jgi:hypothetical protein